MTISDCSEVQFWPVGTDSFNLETPGWTDKYCFSQKFLCTGTRKLQVLGTVEEPQALRLSILENGVEIDTLDFTQSNNGEDGGGGVTTPMTIPALSTWVTRSVSSTLYDWTEGAAPFVNLPGAGYTSVATSEIIHAPYAFIAGNTYEITVDFSKVYNSGSSNPRNIRLEALDNSFNIIQTQSKLTPATDTSDSITLTFVATGLETKIGITALDGSDVDITIDAISGNTSTPVIPPSDPTYYLNEVSFNPYDESWCDKTLTFKIYNKDEEPDEELFYSDPVEFVSVWANAPASGRVVIQYKSNYNFAGLIYSESSPYFSIELEGRFRKIKPITAQKVLELTSMVLNTAASVKKQKHLVLDDLPDYMHTKVALALAHAASGSVLVNGLEVSMEEGYEEGDRPGSYPLTPAEIFLTVKNFYSHNVI